MPPTTPSTLEQKLAALRAAAAKATAHPLMPREAKDAIALLVSVVGELAQQVDWLRRDLASAPASTRGGNGAGGAH